MEGQARGARAARGTNALKGSTKSKRSIANRPDAPYGRLVDTPGRVPAVRHHHAGRVRDGRAGAALGRPGADIAVDLSAGASSRCGSRPVSTKAVDASLVLFEAISPDSKARTGAWACCPTQASPAADRRDDHRPGRRLLPAVAPETRGDRQRQDLHLGAPDGGVPRLRSASSPPGRLPGHRQGGRRADPSGLSARDLWRRCRATRARMSMAAASTPSLRPLLRRLSLS